MRKPLWKRILAALALAFDPARDGRFDDTVFQPQAAHKRTVRR